jgi:prepilin-type N-terminal cleavage/methylation domain-containing protein
MLDRVIVMKNKQGFTLAELIGVIVVLGILALIGVPLMGKYIENSKVEAAKRSAEGIVKSAQQYYTDVMSQDGTFTYTTLDILTNAKLLELEGDLPDGGYVTIDENSNVEVFLITGKYCIRATSADMLTSFTKDLADCAKP